MRFIDSPGVEWDHLIGYVLSGANLLTSWAMTGITTHPLQPAAPRKNNQVDG